MFANLDQVFYTLRSFDLNAQLGRVQFALEMYNLASVLEDRKGDGARNVVEELRSTINYYLKDYKLGMFCSDKGKRKHSHTDDQGRYGGGPGPTHGDGGTAYQLKVHGYKLVLDSFEDEGSTWEPLITVQLRTHFLILHSRLAGSYRPTFALCIVYRTRPALN